MITKIIGGNVMKVKNDIKAFNCSQWLQSQVLIKISLTNSSNERAKPREIILNFKVNGWGSGDPSVEPPTVVRKKFFVSLALCNYQRRRHGLSQIDLMSPSLQASADPPSTCQLHCRILCQQAWWSRCNLPSRKRNLLAASDG